MSGRGRRAKKAKVSALTGQSMEKLILDMCQAIETRGDEALEEIVGWLAERRLSSRTWSRYRLSKLDTCITPASEYALDTVSTLNDETMIENWYHADGYTPIHVAAKKNAIRVLQELHHRGCDLDISSLLGTQPIHLAAAFNSIDCLKFLINQGVQLDSLDLHSATALHYAADRNSIEAMVVLLQHGADVNATDDRNCSPLHCACRGQYFERKYMELVQSMSLSEDTNISLLQSLLQSVAKTAHVLIQYGAQLDIFDHEMKSPFQVACMQGSMVNKQLVRVLVAHGAHRATELATGMNHMRLIYERDFKDELAVVDELLQNWLERRQLLLFFLGLGSPDIGTLMYQSIGHNTRQSTLISIAQRPYLLRHIVGML